MEAANRWETEAIREARERRRGRPTVSQQRKAPDPDGEWRTLREASEETGIPVGTLRKWCRRESVDSYLESDGELTLRMLEMGSVERNARALGRELDGSTQQTADSRQPEERRQTTGDRQQAEGSGQPEAPADAVRDTDYGLRTTADEVGSTMIVPIDAWDKMLTQLGNLHEAGQQLAEARERAAKAETEAKFLRERLTEVREGGRQATGDRRQAGRESGQPTVHSPQPEPGRRQATDNRQQAEPESQQPTADSGQAEPTSVPSAEGSSSSPSGGGAERSEAEGVRQIHPKQTEPAPVPSAEGSLSHPSSSSSPSGGGAERSEAEGVRRFHPEQAEPTPVPSAEGRGDAEERSDDAGGQPSAETTSFWRYVIRGWKGRKR